MYSTPYVIYIIDSLTAWKMIQLYVEKVVYVYVHVTHTGCACMYLFVYKRSSYLPNDLENIKSKM